MSDEDEEEPRLDLSRISTHWSVVGNPTHFVLRYGPAIRAYLLALLGSESDAEDTLQDLLLKVVKGGFERATPDRGRFRFYLKTTVRHAAIGFMRQRKRRRASDAGLDGVAAPGEDVPGVADQAFGEAWRRCVLDRALRQLEAHERRTPGNLGYTVVRLATDHADEASEALAARASQSSGTPLTPEAFRKQLSRARHHLARLIVAEVAETVEGATPERIEDELVESGLMKHVRGFLPADWREGSGPARGERP